MPTAHQISELCVWVCECSVWDFGLIELARWLQVVQEITEELEAKLMEEQMNYTQLQTQRDEMAREFEEVKVQLEEDADR